MNCSCGDGSVLVMNGYEVRARVEEQEEVMRAIVAGKMKREELVAWIEGHMMRME